MKTDDHKNKLSQLERVREIHRLIQRYTDSPKNETFRVTQERLAEELHGISDRQIRRDLDVLRDRIGENDLANQLRGEGDALIYDVAKRSFRYTRPVDLSVWYGRLDDEELGSLLVAQQALAVFSGMPLAKQVSQMFEDDAGGLVGNHRSLLREEITNLVSFYPDGAGKIDATHFALIFRGLIMRQQIEVTYQSKASVAPKSRVLHPYHLCCFKHQWRLIAYDSLSEEIRDFVVTPRRLQSVKQLNRSFKRPANFNAHEHLSRHKDTKVQMVKLLVARPGAHHILERNWYGLTDCRELPGGEVEAVFKVGDEGEFMRFVLAFGKDCKVLEPSSFRDKILAEAREVLA